MLSNFLNSLKTLKHSYLNNTEAFPFSHHNPRIGKQFRAGRKLCHIQQMASYMCVLGGWSDSHHLPSKRKGGKTKVLQLSRFKHNTQKWHTSIPLTLPFPGLSYLASAIYKIGYAIWPSVIKPCAQLKLYYNGKNVYWLRTNRLLKTECRMCTT